MADSATSQGQGRCAVCRGMLDEEELFCGNCGTEAPPNRRERTATTSRDFTHRFTCQGCAAAMSYDAAAQSLRCPFCGSMELKPEADQLEIRPASVVPFVVSREQALSGMRAWLQQGFWRPGDLSESAAVVSMTAVYVPYWVFGAEVHSHWTADTNRTPPGARSSWFPIAGEYQGTIHGLIIGASGALTPSETHALCPFDFSAGVVTDQVDLDNVIVEQFGLTRRLARPLAEQGIDEAVRAAVVRERLPAGSSRNLHVNSLVTGLSGVPALLPVWIMAYRYRDTVFRYLVNGQSGKSIGQAPTSGWKIFMAILIGVGVVLAILMLLVALMSRR